jgi:ABC-type polysaccharide/polyol phosphate transport system ATPase subunit
MPQLALRTVGLNKRYRLGVAEKRATTLREALVLGAGAPIRNLRRLRALTSFAAQEEADVLWALRDVSLEVAHGEVLGLIGRNGAGKSTLLKILSRITYPSGGYAEIRGRVGSLLEVGTGFHPELTGRDNVYLNGSILGMDRRHIDRMFDAIVEFAGVERFIDTPVKRYSSGMYLRLAFAIAAHLEPDVLIVDEVLAVGDAEFQQKCLGRMDEAAREGRTVLFVSHNVGAIQRLCTRSVLLEEGRVVADGATTDVVIRYLASGGAESPPAGWVDLSQARRSGSGVARFLETRYSSRDHTVDFRPYPGGPLEVSVRVRATTVVPRVKLGLTLRDAYGATLMSISTTASGSRASLPEGTSMWVFRISSLALRPGAYQLDLWVGDSFVIHDHLQPALQLEVFDRQERPWGPQYFPRYDGPVFCEYEVTAVESDAGADATRLCQEDVDRT